MKTPIIRLTFCLLLSLLAYGLSLAEEAALVPYFSENGDTKPMIRKQELASIIAKRPNAVKIFEFHDEDRSLILLKLSGSSYGQLIWGGTGHQWSVYDAENLHPIPEKIVGIIEGQFAYISDDENTKARHTWGIHEQELDLKNSTKLLFSFLFPIPNSREKKKITVAVDWKSGRTEGVRVVSVNLTGKNPGP